MTAPNGSNDAAGFRRTEGPDGPLMLAYERELWFWNWCLTSATA